MIHCAHDWDGKWINCLELHNCWTILSPKSLRFSYRVDIEEEAMIFRPLACKQCKFLARESNDYGFKWASCTHYKPYDWIGKSVMLRLNVRDNECLLVQFSLMSIWDLTW